MSQDPTPEQRVQNAIAYGRAYVRLSESAEYLLTRNPSLVERLTLRWVRTMSTHILRRLVAELPTAITDEIFAASDRMMGRVTGFTHN